MIRKRVPLILVILCACMFTSIAAAQEEPYIEASVSNDWMAVYNFEAGANIDILIYPFEGSSEAYSTSVPLDSRGEARLETDALGTDLIPGNVIVATDGSSTKELTIVDLSVVGVDYSAGLVWGTADTALDLRVQVGDELQSYSIPVFLSDGSWLADFDTEGFEIQEHYWIGVIATEPDGDWTLAELPPPPSLPWFEANVTGNWISANGFLPATEVTVTVFEGGLPSAERFSAIEWTDGDGWAWFDLGEQGLEPWNYVEVYDGASTKGLLILPLTLDVFDPEADYIAGTAPENSFVRVDVWIDEFDNASMEVQANSDGGWEADFSTISPDAYDVSPDAWYAAFIVDEDGDSTMAELSPPPPQPFILVWPAWNWINGIGFPEGSVVTLIVDEDQDPENGFLYSTTGVSVPSDWNPDETVVNFELSGDVDLQHGYVVVLSYDGIVKVHVITSLAISGVDPVDDLVSGSAKAGSGVSLWVNDIPGTDLYIEADSSGFWTADFNLIYDFVPGTAGIAAQFDEDGDATFMEWSVITPDGIIDLIQAMVENGDIAPELEYSLSAKVTSAMASIEDGKHTPAIRKLSALIHEVEAQRGHKIDQESADMLISLATQLIALLEGS
jgi:hypothetical protein